MSTKKTVAAPIAAFVVDADADANVVNSVEAAPAEVPAVVDEVKASVDAWAVQVKAGSDTIASARDVLARFANATFGNGWWDLAEVKEADIEATLFEGANDKPRWESVKRFGSLVRAAVKANDIKHSNATALFNSIKEESYKLHKVNVHNMTYAASVTSAVAEGKAPPAYAEPKEIELKYDKRHAVNADGVSDDDKAVMAIGVEMDKYKTLLGRVYRLNMKIQDIVEKAQRPADPRLTDSNVQLHAALIVVGVDPATLNV
jgi:hypothetical protein